MIDKSLKIKRRFFPKSHTKKKLEGSYLTLSTSKNNSFCGFAVVVSKKNIKRAVDRNKIKRRVYSAIKEVVKGERPRIMNVFYVKGTLKNAKYSDIKNDVSSLIRGCKSG